MVSPMSSTLSALSAFSKRLDVTADNVANVETDGFKRSRVIFEEGSSGGVSATIRRDNSPGVPKESFSNGTKTETESSNVDLTDEMTDLLTTKAGYQANLKVVSTRNDMLGSLLDIMG